MTCIVGIVDKENDCVWMGGDSLASNRFMKAIISDSKVFRYEDRDDVIMGSCGLVRHMDLLRYDNTLFDKVDKYENTKIDHKYMVTKFIPKVQTLFNNGGAEYVSNGVKEGANFLVGVGNKLFEIQEDYGVIDYADEFNAVGSGEYHAMASLCSTKDLNLSCKERVIKALESAEHNQCGVQRPFVIMNTKDKEVEIIK